LNNAAVIAADEDFYAQHPEFVEDGKRIPLDPHDPIQAPLRREWMDSYLRNGGSVEQSGEARPKSLPSSPKGACDCEKTRVAPAPKAVATKPVVILAQKPAAAPGNSLANTGLKNAISIALDTQHFVPEVEKIKVRYRTTGPISQIRSLRLVVSTVAKPDEELCEYQVRGPYQTSDVILWDGANNSRGFLNLASSPFLLRWEAETDNGSHCVSERVKLEILVERIEILVADPEIAGAEVRYRKSITKMAAEASVAGGGRLVIPSSIFKDSAAEMNDNSAYKAYQEQVQRGPTVPLLARVFLKGQDGSEKRCASVVQGVRILWDVQYADDALYQQGLNARRVHAVARAYLKNATTFRKELTRPTGRACHQLLGGIRSTPEQRTRETDAWQNLSGWRVQIPERRTWAAHSVCLSTTLDADTGIGFRGSARAGDQFVIRAYVDHDHAADIVADGLAALLPPERTSNAVAWENWRSVRIVANYRVGTNTAPLDPLWLKEPYAEACMEFEDATGGTSKDITAQWKAEYQRVITREGLGDAWLRNALLDDPGGHPVAYREFNDFSRREASGWGLSMLSPRVQQMFSTPSEKEYYEECSKQAQRIYYQVVAAFTLSRLGLALFRFPESGEHNHQTVSGTYTAGTAPSITGYTDRSHAVFMVFQKQKDGDGGIGGGHTNIERTLIHEVGHVLFLAHAPGYFPSKNASGKLSSGDSRDAQPQPPGFQRDAHDDAEWCVMSYHKSNPLVLCGQCILKLSAWDVFGNFDRKGIKLT